MALPALNNSNNNQSWFKTNMIQIIQLIVVFLGIFMGGAWYLSGMSKDIQGLSKQNEEILKRFDTISFDNKKIADLVTYHDKIIATEQVERKQNTKDISSIKDAIDRLESNK